MTVLHDYGAAVGLRFAEEASLRADRLWRADTEELALLCFQGAEGAFLAEAVQITRRSPTTQ